MRHPFRSTVGTPHAAYRPSPPLGAGWWVCCSLLLVALCPTPLLAHPLLLEGPAQQPAQPLERGSSTLELTLSMHVRELRFQSSPNLRVRLAGRSDAEALNDTCQFEQGVTYTDVGIRLEVSDAGASLTCSTPVALGEAPGDPSAPGGEPAR